MKQNLQTKFSVRNQIVSLYTQNNDTIYDELPVGVYSIDFNPMQGFFLKIMGDRIDTPARIYGNIDTRIDRCITTFEDFDKSMGILLTGEKGTGKTLFINSLANAVMDRLELPIVLVREPYHGEDFENFLRELGPTCILFDEFGKMYRTSNRHGLGSDSDGPRQEHLLTLMDGMDRTKRLLLFSENNEWSISDFMMNRPSRIHYHFRYAKMAEDSVLEFCAEHELSEKDTNDVKIFYRMSHMFTFDMLQGIVREVKRYGITVTEALEFLNVDSKASDVYLDVTKIERCDEYADRAMWKDGKIVIRSNTIVKPTLNHEANVHAKLYFMRKPDDEEPREEGIYIDVSADECIYEDDKSAIYESDGFRVHTSISPKKWSTSTMYDYDF